MSRALALALALVAILTATGCGPDTPAPETKAPTLGGVTPTSAPPAAAMDSLEKPIAERLADQVADQGLHVDHLDCPSWDGAVPASLTCTGWFDRVEGEVAVSLSKGAHGQVSFDAVLTTGVIATRRLVDELIGKGYDDVDCGSVPAYPTEVGSSLTCSGRSSGELHFLRVTITDDHGGVTIADF